MGEGWAGGLGGAVAGQVLSVLRLPRCVPSEGDPRKGHLTALGFCFLDGEWGEGGWGLGEGPRQVAGRASLSYRCFWNSGLSCEVEN